MHDEDGGGISTIITFALQIGHMLSTVLCVFYTFLLYIHNSIKLLLPPSLSLKRLRHKRLNDSVATHSDMRMRKCLLVFNCGLKQSTHC